MDKKASYVLFYMRNGREVYFPVETIDQAVFLADAIADSDLLNKDVDYNLFDVFLYINGEPGEPWMSANDEDFEEYWRNDREKKNNKP